MANYSMRVTIACVLALGGAAAANAETVEVTCYSTDAENCEGTFADSCIDAGHAATTNP